MRDVSEDNGESSRDLWHAVIAQALQDATGKIKVSLSELERHQARRWLTVPNRDFNTVCEFAGEEPDQVRALAVKLIAEADVVPLNLCGSHLTRQRPKPAALTPSIPRLPPLRPARVLSARRMQPATGRQSASFTHDGVTRTATEWAMRLGISRTALFNRIASGWPLERALTEVISPRAKRHREALKSKREAKA